MLSQSGQGMMEQWTEAHPHLAELVRLHRCLEEAFVGAGPCACPPLSGRTQGFAPTELPLFLHHRPDAPFFAQAGELLRQVLTAMPAEGLPEQFCQQCSQLREQVQHEPAAAARLIESQLAGAEDAGDGLARFLIWKLLAKLLVPWREDLEQRLPELAWEEPICPLCGAGPSMAQLVRTSTGRNRFLVCGCCTTRWKYKRIGCPYCGNEEQGQLSIIEPDDDLFRIDCCQQCQGYLKTYLGRGAEELMLTDWSSLHLDALAMQQGWQRRADSLYRL